MQPTWLGKLLKTYFHGIRTRPPTVIPWLFCFVLLKENDMTHGRHGRENCFNHDMLVDFTNKFASIMACGRPYRGNCFHDLLELEGFCRHNLHAMGHDMLEVFLDITCIKTYHLS